MKERNYKCLKLCNYWISANQVQFKWNRQSFIIQRKCYNCGKQLVHLMYITVAGKDKKKKRMFMFGQGCFWHLMCMRISLVDTDAFNIISQSILLAYLYRASQYLKKRRFFPQLPVWWSPTVLLQAQQCLAFTALIITRSLNRVPTFYSVG